MRCCKFDHDGDGNCHIHPKDSFARELLETASALLNEVRTGEDFEGVCWEHAEKIDAYLEDRIPEIE